MSKRGMVYYQDRLAGIVAETDGGYEFTYDTDYLSTETAKPISLTFLYQKRNIPIGFCSLFSMD